MNRTASSKSHGLREVFKSDSILDRRRGKSKFRSQVVIQPSSNILIRVFVNRNVPFPGIRSAKMSVDIHALEDSQLAKSSDFIVHDYI